MTTSSCLSYLGSAERKAQQAAEGPSHSALHGIADGDDDDGDGGGGDDDMSGLPANSKVSWSHPNSKQHSKIVLVVEFASIDAE